MDIPENILSRISTPKPHAPRTEWESTIEPFYHRINTPASLNKYGEMTRGRIGKALKGKSAMEISRLFKDCSKARSFAGLFRSLTHV
jgi:hypothetical protein